MNPQLKWIGPLSYGKIFALIMAVIGLIVGFILAVVFIVLAAMGTKDMSMGVAVLLGLLCIVLGPIIYGILGFVLGVIGSAIYNLIAKLVGGIEVRIE
jgi:hypothetical protein